ncbi:MAG: Coenzyme F420 hydrogenase/dehydrogenase, beta subunit C-terminal domain [Desulfobacterales bacterium]|nr:Coenzyme F420 hydrogenase/dehydrogenase, beta subunit C-terminal domain [Desulfobacterales bacterium]
MKTFLNLIEEVQNKGLCHHCGGCVTFCTSINYGALEMGKDGSPVLAYKEKCIECGLCYSVCPEINELEDETKKMVRWIQPYGNVLETNIARAIDTEIKNKATDGGVVTALLKRLFERGHIDGAIVTKQKGHFNREPWLASSIDEIIQAAGFSFETSYGMHQFGEDYSTFAPSVQEFRPMLQKGLRRVALVGTPCQIKAVRKMEVLRIVPSDSIKYCLGLFCSGNFSFNEEQRKKLEDIGNFKWSDVKKVNIKEALLIHLINEEIRTIDLDKLDFMKRYACRYCSDYSAEYADVSFGGIGANEGWTTVISRTPLGRAIFADAKGNTIETFINKDEPNFLGTVLNKVLKASDKKRKISEKYRTNM